MPENTPEAYRVRIADAAEPYTLADPFGPVRHAADQACDAPDLLEALAAAGRLVLYLEAAAEQAQNAATALRDLLASVMDETGATHVRLSDRHTAYIRQNSPRIWLHDPAAIPAELMVQPPPRPDLDAIRRRLTRGEEVPGARLGNAGSVSLAIRTTKD